MTKTVQSLERGLAVLELLNRHNGLTSNQVAKRCSLSRGTAHRMLETLRAEDYVLRDELSGAYWLTLKVRGLSDGYIDELWIASIVRPKIEQLGRKLIWPVNLTVPSGLNMMVRAATDYHSRLANYRIPTGWCTSMAGSASGRTFLAFCSDKDRNTFVDLISKTSASPRDEVVRDPAQWRKKLSEIRSRGYDTQVSDENMTAISIPIFEKKHAFACLTTRYSSLYIESLETALERFIPELRSTADEIGEQYAKRTTTRNQYSDTDQAIN
ncbi:MAG: helix-turn-helix domain-containing protein [Pseudomonadales bacterium]